MTRRNWYRLLTVLVAVVDVALLQQFVDVMGYRVYATYFSPDTFTFRSTQHVDAGIPVWPSRSADWRTPLIEHLIEEGYVTPWNVSSPRWHYVHGHRNGVKGMIGEAKCAYRAFREDELVAWSKAHPEHARYVWPKVVQHTRDERYGLVGFIVQNLRRYDGTLDELRELVERAEAKLDEW